MHIADSVQNRIINAARKIPATPSPMAQPQAPDPRMAGAAIDQAVSTPPPAMAPPPEAEATAATAALEDGSSAADALGQQAMLEVF